MSSSVSKTNHFYLKVQPSSYLGALLLLFYLGALILLWIVPISVWIKLGLSILLIWDGRRHWRRYVSRVEAQAVQWLIWHGEGEWSLWQMGGEHIAHLQLLQSVNHPLLIVLNFTRRHHLVLLPDSGDTDQLRKLRVLLRHSLNDLD